MGFRGGVKLTPPSISWFSSTPAEIGLNGSLIFLATIIHPMKSNMNRMNVLIKGLTSRFGPFVLHFDKFASLS